uniref:Protein 2 of mRNA virt-1 n=1 Tax=Human adenovirus A serotype 12 TaxID=28282 RepID=Q89799_ADE12|nr:protein 2 of mRNA virt-2 [Human adenovirus 12]CAA23410.1 protein 2 of mRNA virt-1 [Human adenovirus 12]
MEREIPPELGLHAGLHVNAAVEGMAEEEGLHLLAGAAFDHAAAADVARGEGGGAEPCGGGEVNMEQQCECGSSHLELRPIVLNVTEELRSDHLTLSCLRTDYESSDEDDN